MKIGVLTYFWDENPGTLLQAYSMLKLMGNVFKDANVELINYRHCRFKFKIFRNYFKYRYFLNDLSRRIVYDRFKHMDLNIGEQGVVTTDIQKAIRFINAQRYDAIIVGSDTVWQFSKKSDRPPFPNVYWVPTEIEARKAAFAVSSSVTKFSDLSEQQVATLRSILHDFSFLAVRDGMTFELLRLLGDNQTAPTTRVPDPTFLVEIPTADISSIIRKYSLDRGKPVLGVNLPPTLSFYNDLVADYKKMGFRILSFVESGNADIVLPNLGPFEWASIFKLLSFSITDRFHGTIFSLKNKVPVLAVDWHPSRFDGHGNSKTFSLLSDFGMEGSSHINVSTCNVDHKVILGKCEEARHSEHIASLDDKLMAMRARGMQVLEQLVTALADKPKRSAGFSDA